MSEKIDIKNVDEKALKWFHSLTTQECENYIIEFLGEKFLKPPYKNIINKLYNMFIKQNEKSKEEHVQRKLLEFSEYDPTNTPLFFGKPLGFQRYDIPKFQRMLKIDDMQMSFFWRPNEINLTKDREDFENMNELEKFIFTQNIGYQIILDSVQSRGVLELLTHCSNLELEAFIFSWAFFEKIHSQSYTYILKNVYPNPSEIFDGFAKDSEIMKRCVGATHYYDKYINNVGTETEYQRKKTLYLTIISIQILEFVRFYISFACSYYFAENGKMMGTANIIKLINRDEQLHGAFTSLVIKKLRNNEDEGFVEIAKECDGIVEQMWLDAGTEEMEWVDYLFEKGDLIGINANILKQYMKYLVNLRMKSCGFNPVYEKTKNPITWIQKYVKTENIQQAPQETESISYLSNSVDANIGDTSHMADDL